MLKSVMSLICLVFLSNPSWANVEACSTDAKLKNMGWVVVRTPSLESFFQKLQSWQQSESDKFVDDLNGNFFSSVAKKFLVVKTYDFLPTPQSIMYGDLVYYFNHQTEELVEARWYKDGKKHVAYDSSQTPCATNNIPIAENTIF